MLQKSFNNLPTDFTKKDLFVGSLSRIKDIWKITTCPSEKYIIMGNPTS